MSGKHMIRQSVQPTRQASHKAASTVLSALSATAGVLLLSPSGMVLGANNNLMTWTGIPTITPGMLHYSNILQTSNISSFQMQWTQMTTDFSQVWSLSYKTSHDNTHAECCLDALFFPVHHASGELDYIIALHFPPGNNHNLPSDTDHNLLTLAMQATDHGICIVNQAQQLVYMNTGIKRMLGLADTHLNTSLANALVHHVGLVSALEECRQILAQQHHHHVEIRLHDRKNRALWVTLHAHRITTEADADIVCILTDITHLKIQEILQYKAFKAIAHGIGLHETMGLICQEIDDVIPDAVASIHSLDPEQQLTPLAGPDLPAAFIPAVKAWLLHPDNTSVPIHTETQYTAHAALLLEPSWQHDVHRFADNGLTTMWMSVLHATNGQAIGLLVFYCVEATSPGAFHRKLIELVKPIVGLAFERESSRSHIERLAYYDALTGLANRGLLMRLATDAITQATLTDTCVAVLFIDLDRFKQINDSLGHQAGDELLRTIGARLKSVSRKSDIVGRLSGDEFLIVLVNCQRDHIVEIVHRIQTTLGAPCHIDGVAITPSASIGISVFPDNGNTIETLLHRADLAMYLSKDKLHGGFSFFNEAMNTEAQDNVSIEAALRTALTDNAFTLHYQPQVNLHTHSLHGVEALIRWEHSEWQTIQPAQFIAIAEASGLIGELTRWVIEAACRQMADWRDRAIPVPSIAINLSAMNFHDASLANTIATVLARYAVPAQCITIEITETVLMDTNPDTSQNINDLCTMGIRLAIDDFGTGYSSLAYLRHLPVSAIKLDQSFIQDIETDPTVSALTNAMINIGDSLKLTVIAEGVNTTTQYDLLQQYQCDAVQGHLLSPAITATQLEQWITEHLPDTRYLHDTAQLPLF
jgi:diguanylate cyclase (GGDEF)-like protein/PAS domain S-box-containing protein